MRNIQPFYATADAPPAPAPAPAADPKAAPVSGQPPIETPPPPKKFEFAEDRSNWVKPEDHGKLSTSLKANERLVAKLQGELEAERRRLAALSGATVPKTPEELEAEKLVQSFHAVPGFKHLAALTPERMEKLERLLERDEELADTIEQQKAVTFNYFVRGIEKELAWVFGSEALTETQTAMIRPLFVSMLRRDPETYGPRYREQDPTLITEFVKQFDEAFATPLRRLKAAEIANKPKVPFGGRSQPVTTTVPKVDTAMKPGESRDQYIDRMTAALSADPRVA